MRKGRGVTEIIPCTVCGIPLIQSMTYADGLRCRDCGEMFCRSHFYRHDDCRPELMIHGARATAGPDPPRAREAGRPEAGHRGKAKPEQSQEKSSVSPGYPQSGEKDPIRGQTLPPGYELHRYAGEGWQFWVYWGPEIEPGETVLDFLGHIHDTPIEAAEAAWTEHRQYERQRRRLDPVYELQGGNEAPDQGRA